MSDLGALAPDDEGLAQGEINALRAALRTSPPPDILALEALIGQLHLLTKHHREHITRQAHQLELEALGALLTRQAADLRALAQRLQQLARWLPPERSDQN